MNKNTIIIRLNVKKHRLSCIYNIDYLLILVFSRWD